MEEKLLASITFYRVYADKEEMKDFILENIDTSFKCYNQFVHLYSELQNLFFEDITIHLNKWFGANMSAVLSGILDKVDITNSINIVSDDDKILSILKKNGFLANYGHELEQDTYLTTCRHLKLSPNQSRYFNSYVINELLNKTAFPDMSAMLKEKIAESIYEVFVNAQMHSKTSFIYTCGQFFPKKNKIEFTIVDTGIGFKRNINSALNTSFSSIEAIKWAIKDSNTTKTDVPGGLGLAILTEFIKKNDGKFQIISDTGFLELTKNTEHYDFLKAAFPGTIINMEFRTDDIHSYRLSNEIDFNDIF